TEAALGPWTDQAMHGGPPAMLMARAIERFQSDGDMVVTRITIELLRQAGRNPLAVRCRAVRPCRKVRLVEASLWREDDEVARATGLLIRRAPAADRGVGAGGCADVASAAWRRRGRGCTLRRAGQDRTQYASAAARTGRPMTPEEETR